MSIETERKIVLVLAAVLLALAIWQARGPDKTVYRLHNNGQVISLRAAEYGRCESLGLGRADKVEIRCYAWFRLTFSGAADWFEILR